MCCGFAVGLIALWLEGYDVPLPWSPAAQTEALQPWAPPAGAGRPHGFFVSLYGQNQSMPVLACYLGFFGLMFLVLRWWKTTDPNRGKRFSLKPLIATAFWAYVLLFLLPGVPHRHTAFVALLGAAITLQAVSPWREREPRCTTKRRRYVAVEQVGG
jgi:hypothetical protein